MKSSTKRKTEQPARAAAPPEHPLLQAAWEQVTQRLPANLAQSAKTYKAMQRCREIPSAEALLHLAFLYVLPDGSYRHTAMLATLQHICHISDVDLMNRLANLPAWLGALVVQQLQRQGLAFPAQAPLRLKIVDATVISQPQSRGTDWRLHVSLDLAQLRIDQVVITNEHTGEGFGNFSLSPQDIYLADSGYTRTRGLAQVLQAGAQFVTREQWNTMPVWTSAGKPFDIIAWLTATFSPDRRAPAETQVYLSTAQGLQPVRLLACPLPPEKAEAARRRARQRSRQKKHQPMEKNLYAVGFVLLLTNLSAHCWNTAQVLALYRWRWQIELYFKRLKSLLVFDHLHSHRANLIQTYLLIKLLAAILVDGMRAEFAHQAPAMVAKVEAPLSMWRLDAYLIQTLLRWVIGPWPSWQQVIEMLPQLERYLCGSPRKRPQQLALARAQFAALGFA